MLQRIALIPHKKPMYMYMYTFYKNILIKNKQTKIKKNYEYIRNKIGCSKMI